MSNCTSAPPAPFGSGFVAFSGATIVTPRRLSCDNWLNVLRASSNARRHGLFRVGVTKMVSCLGLRFLTLSAQGVGVFDILVCGDDALLLGMRGRWPSTLPIGHLVKRILLFLVAPVFVAPVFAPSISAHAQADDKAYCAELAAFYRKYIQNTSRRVDVEALAAVNDCQNGDAADGHSGVGGQVASGRLFAAERI